MFSEIWVVFKKHRGCVAQGIFTVKSKELDWRVLPVRVAPRWADSWITITRKATLIHQRFWERQERHSHRIRALSHQTNQELSDDPYTSLADCDRPVWASWNPVLLGSSCTHCMASAHLQTHLPEQKRSPHQTTGGRCPWHRLAFRRGELQLSMWVQFRPTL